MNAPVWFHNLVAYSVQIALLVIAGELLPRVFCLRVPRALLAYWQCVLAGCLALPILQPWRPATAPPAVVTGIGSVRIDEATRAVAT